MLVGHLPPPINLSITGLEDWIPTLNESNQACPWGEDGVMSPQPMVVGGTDNALPKKISGTVMERRWGGYH